MTDLPPPSGSTPPPPPPPPSGDFGAPPPGYTAAPPGYAAPGYAMAPSREYAGFWLRFGAFVLDRILYGLVFAIFAVPAVVLGVSAFDGCVSIENSDGTIEEIVCPPGKPEAGLLAGGIALAVIGIVVVLVIYVRALGRTGKTWGRSIVGITVVSKETGAPIGTGRALGRTLFEGTISQWVCYLGYLWMLWQPERQTWHDMVVGSVVVKDNA